MVNIDLDLHLNADLWKTNTEGSVMPSFGSISDLQVIITLEHVLKLVIVIIICN